MLVRSRAGALGRSDDLRRYRELLGVVTLETMGLMLNPPSRKILPMRLSLMYGRP